MTTSGSIDLTFTAQELITYALRLINITAQHETPEANDSERGRVEMNMMLKDWMRYEHIWRVKEGYVLIVADQAGYSLTPRPHRVHDMRYRNASSLDTTMIEMTRDQYYNLPDKASKGIPTQWFFDPQRDSDSLWIWPVLDTLDTTTPETLRVTYQRRFEDVDTLTETLDITQAYLGVVGYNLAARLADSFGRSGGHIDRIVGRAEQLKEEMMDDDREDFVQFVPDMSRYG